ncbi:hypothetical protein CDD82_967 [Ophiocordyceps australis]|uniref:Uncharacterized protein n=1 Tax=Ophiocordyceps australis TaxID=1399860 RepID=A0A2C5ZPK9_9HYPO|nr:hypothetical protein CDD82_967 [Ophiocordyceps australis]
MDDQFGGRTDDDLFNDDFEPVESESVVISDNQPITSTPRLAAAPAPTTSSVPSKSLDDSYFAKPAPNPSAQAATAPPAQAPAPLPSHAAPAPPQPPTDVPKSRSHPRSHGGATQKPKINPSASAANSKTRIQSGANPRQKPTDAELADKMQRMKLLAAEQTRKFQAAADDERFHAAAVERGAHEAARRNAAAAQQRRHLEDERAKNRERKLRAMSAKQGGWDEGKEELAKEETASHFRGSNGGIRGAKSGLLGSHFAPRGSANRPDVDRFLEDHVRPGRGRGRPNPNRGRNQAHGTQQHYAKPTPPPPPVADDFPALPPVKISDKSTTKLTPAPPPVISLPTPPAGGKWDDEMEALDALKRSQP